MRKRKRERQLQEERRDRGWNNCTGKTEDNYTNREDRGDKVSEDQRKDNNYNKEGWATIYGESNEDTPLNVVRI